MCNRQIFPQAHNAWPRLGVFPIRAQNREDCPLFAVDLFLNRPLVLAAPALQR